MGLMWLVDLIVLIILIYFIFIHGYILGRRKFKCLRCGRCCRFRVTLSKDEINKIKKAGYKERDFIVKKNELKRINGNCVFLTCNNGVCSCELQNSAKPSTCVNFPAIKGLFGKENDYRCRAFWRFKKKSV
jgi:Fe-S-cluster containining protein